MLLELLQQIRHLDVGIAIVSVFDGRALAKQRVRLIKEENRVARLRRVKDLVEVLLRLADVFAHDRRQVCPVHVEVQLEGGMTDAVMVLPVPDGPANETTPTNTPRALIASLGGGHSSHLDLA